MSLVKKLKACEGFRCKIMFENNIQEAFALCKLLCIIKHSTFTYPSNEKLENDNGKVDRNIDQKALPRQSSAQNKYGMDIKGAFLWGDPSSDQ